jgi:hypothetical protein
LAGSPSRICLYGSSNGEILSHQPTMMRIIRVDDEDGTYGMAVYYSSSPMNFYAHHGMTKLSIFGPVWNPESPIYLDGFWISRTLNPDSLFLRGKLFGTRIFRTMPVYKVKHNKVWYIGQLRSGTSKSQVGIQPIITPLSSRRSLPRSAQDRPRNMPSS